MGGWIYWWVDILVGGTLLGFYFPPAAAAVAAALFIKVGKEIKSHLC